MEQRKSNRDVKGLFQVGKPPMRAETNALFDGGFNRSSKEDSVMELERRVEVIQLRLSFPPLSDGESRREAERTKVLPITKQMVWNAYKKVKSNKGSSGVDGESLWSYSQNLSNNLYCLWNELSSGSYFPLPVLSKAIKKDNGKSRILGIPTVRDRIAQQVIKDHIETRFESVFDESSYGYRPGKSAHDALASVTKGVRQQDWVIDLDISSFFDEVNHDLLNRALVLHIEEDWILTYLNRFLNTPFDELEESKEERKEKGTPQGGVISPLLANLYLHYTLDKWLRKYHSKIKFVRYADDIIIHCSSKSEAEELLSSVKSRLSACKLQANEDKTSIVYCKQSGKKATHPKVKFDFLGYSFQPRPSRSKGGMFLGYSCAISRKSEQKIVLELRRSKFHLWTGRDISDLSNHFNGKLRGWINYYGKYNKRRLQRVMSQFNDRLIKWACLRYKRFKRSYRKASKWLRNLGKVKPTLFYHWEAGFLSS